MAKASYVLFVDNIAGLDPSRYDPKKLERSIYLATNATAKHAQSRGAERMMDQINFPSSYLKGPNSRLYVSSYATRSKAEAVVTGRFRPTSLARFATGKKTRHGVIVEVKPGRQREIKGAFLMKLKSGKSDTNNNMGLAVRTKRGERPRKAYGPVRINDRLWLLYGPSVSQAFKSIREQIAEPTAIFYEQELRRLLDTEFD